MGQRVADAVRRETQAYGTEALQGEIRYACMTIRTMTSAESNEPLP